METDLKNKLREWADEYEQPFFIQNEPILFPRRLYDQGARIEDIEISAVISSWMAYENRKPIIKKLFEIHDMLGKSPLDYIRSRKWERYAGCHNLSLYRFYTLHDFYNLCRLLYKVYDEYASIHSMSIQRSHKTPLDFLMDLFNNTITEHIMGFPETKYSPCNKLCLLLRWMVRRNSPVDMGLWTNLEQEDLLIPLDTHVHRIARELWLTKRPSVDMETAIEITEEMKQVFPNDPARGDFALFGYGINNK